MQAHVGIAAAGRSAPDAAQVLHHVADRLCKVHQNERETNLIEISRTKVDDPPLLRCEHSLQLFFDAPR